MKTRLFVLIVMFFIVALLTKISAQNISIGVRGGLTIPNLHGGAGNPLSEGYSSRSGIGFGAFADFKLSNLFSIQPMLEYSQQGGKHNGFQAFTTPSDVAAAFKQEGQTPPEYMYADYKSEAKFNYLMLPVLAKFGWGLGHTNLWRIYVDAGPFAALLLNAHQVISGGNQPVYLDEGKTMPFTDQNGQQVSFPFNETDNIKSSLHNFNCGVEGNIGISYAFKKNKVFLEGGGNYGFLNIQKYARDGKNHSGAATAMVGYAYAL